MRVGFAGTPEFAARALEAIVAAGFDVPLVLTQPDRPKGRGLVASSSPVKRWAAARGIPVLQPDALKTALARAPLLDIPLDVLVVAAYGLILPRDVLDWPQHGCLNIHASRLPRWRGAAPIQRAVEAGDTATGVTIMQMDEGLDTGPTIEFVDVGIAPRETSGTLHDKLARAGAEAIVAVLTRLARDGVLASMPQPASGVTYARKLDRADAAIDWSRASAQIDCQIRAFDPAPGATATFGGAGVKVWRAEPVAHPHQAPGGTVLVVDREGIAVACGAGALKLRELQPASGKRMSASAFAAGHEVVQGSRFGAPAPL
jgi:methionyl-tRNA formyltransferase